MLANFFSKSKPVNFMIIIILFLGYYILDVLVYRSLDIGLEVFLHIPMYLFIFFLYNFIITKNRLTKDDSYAFLLFVIGLGCLPHLDLHVVSLLEYILLFLFLRKVYSIRWLKLVNEKLFDGGLWLGVLFLISPEYVLYALLLLLALFFFAKVTFRAVFIPVLGFLTPLFLFFTYHFWFDSMSTFYALFTWQFSAEFESYNTLFYLVSLAFFGTITGIATLLRSGRVFSVSNRFRSIWILLLVQLLISLVVVSLAADKDGSELILVLIPATIIIANWLRSVQLKNTVTFILLLFLLVSFVVHFIV